MVRFPAMATIKTGARYRNALSPSGPGEAGCGTSETDNKEVVRDPLARNLHRSFLSAEDD